MDKKKPDQGKRKSIRGLLTPEEAVKMSINYGGCMGAIVFLTFLIRWLVGIFKGF